MLRVRSIVLFPLLAAAFLAAGHRAWLSREVVVSVGLRAAAPVPCQIFYTDATDAIFTPERAVSVAAHPRGNPVRVPLPVARLEGLRLDFGIAPGTVRAGPVTVAGRTASTLDWRDFSVRHDIGRFDVGADGAVDVESVGGDPYAVHSKPIDVRGRLRVNGFVFVALVCLAVLATLAFDGFRIALRGLFAARGERGRNVAFLLAAFALVIARLALVARIPPWFGASVWDDHWFVNAADSLLRGNWLGAYDQHTLCKGCFGPMVLAVSSLIGVPFLVAETILFLLGCASFVIVLSRLVRNRALLLFSFALLLFNPTSYSLVSFQRIYRNGMSLWQVPVVVGCLFAAFRTSRGPVRRLAAWALASGVALWAFQNTREDGIWLWPFAIVCLTVSAVRAWGSGATGRGRAGRALLCLLPLAIVLLGNAVLCAANGHIYGVPIRNDRDAGNYAKAMRDLYLIAPNPEDEARLSSPEHARHYHNIYYSTLCKAYEASPTLRQARGGIDNVIARWARFQGYEGMDLRHDHMLFAIRDGMASVGYYGSLPESERFFGNVHRELSAAFADGRLSRRGFSFTAMAAPFRWKFVPGILREWKAALLAVSTFSGVEAACMDDDRSARTAAPAAMLGAFERTSRHKASRGGSGAAAREAVVRANAAARAFSAFARWALPAALVLYFLLSVALFLRRTRMDKLLDGWLLATGMLGSLLLHTACIAYMSATTFWATNYYYLASSGQLALMFAAVVMGMCVSWHSHSDFTED